MTNPAADPAAMVDAVDAVRVVFIAGTGRSGSTILAASLGSVPGVASLGEVRYLWKRGVAEGSLCGCGVPVSDCQVWHKVLDVAYPDGHIDAGAAVEAAERLFRLRSLPGLLIRSALHPGSPIPALAPYIEHLDRVYRALGEVLGDVILVDSSKLPTYGWALSRTPCVDLEIVHLVRDARGAAFSWGKQQDRGDRGEAVRVMGRQGPAHSAADWVAWNLSVLLLFRGRHRRIRYEDFVSDPHGTLSNLAGSLGITDGLDDIARDRRVNIEIAHTVAGNPNRMRGGVLTIEPDYSWRRNMPWRARIIVTAVAAPLLARYKYLGRRR